MTFTESNEPPNEEISQLFEEAKDKLDKLKEESNKKKKDIVIQLAKDLEGKIPIDTISMEIVQRLKGHISPSLIHEYLDEKYKQKICVQNAKKQKKKQEIDLAPPSALNKVDTNVVEIDAEGQKNKQVIIIGTGGTTYAQIEDDVEGEQPSKTSTGNDYSALTCKSIGQPLYASQNQQEQEQLDELYQSAETMNKTEHTTGASFETSSCVDIDVDMLPFEFSINRIDLQNYLKSCNFDADEKIWFNGKINTRTREVNCAFGRLYQQNMIMKPAKQ